MANLKTTPGGNLVKSLFSDNMSGQEKGYINQSSLNCGFSAEKEQACMNVRQHFYILEKRF